MLHNKKYRWRKTSDINRDYSIFELLENDLPLLDAGLNNDGVFEVIFNPSIAGQCLSWKKLQELLNECEIMAHADI